MTEQTLTTTQTLEYIRDHTGRDTTPHRSTLARYKRRGYLAPYSHGGDNNRLQNTYLLSDLRLLCERINDNYWRKAGQKNRDYSKP